MNWITKPDSEKSSSFFPILGSSLMFILILGGMIAAGMRACQGHFGYPLDDTYIHMAMAKNFALHGVWGITKYSFSSSTSSPLYTLLLASCYLVTGVHEVTPLVLNIAAGIGLLFCCDQLLRAKMSRLGRAATLMLIVVAIPLPTLALVGMEHVVHTLLTLLFVHFCCRLLIQSRANHVHWTVLIGLTVCLVTARYEAVFLVALTGLLFFIKGRWSATLALAVASTVPLSVYGLISISKGWYFLPNSLLLKANLPSTQRTGLFGSFLGTLVVNFSQGFHVVLLVLLAGVVFYIGYRINKTVWTYAQVWMILFCGTALMHLCFARVGWFYRYEAYLVAFGVIGVALAICDLGSPPFGKLTGVCYFLTAAFILLISYRFEHATVRAPQAIADIYDQQYQMGLFARDYLGEQTLVLNDIGAVSFLSGVRVMDLIGLGSVAPVVARVHHEYSPAWLYDWSKTSNATVAITYRYLAAKEWREVAMWRIPGNYMSGSDTVGIYSVDLKGARVLGAQELAFRRRLPQRVVFAQSKED